MLRARDLPNGFVAFDEGELEPTDVTAGVNADATGPRRIAGWKARYRRRDRTHVRGPLIVESIVELYGDDDAASDALASYRRAVTRTRGGLEREAIEAPPVGDERVAVTFVQPARVDDVLFYVVVWRTRNVTSILTVQGFERGLTSDDARALATAQDRAMAAAAR
ncbi:MAG TPA: hypothetical protein VHJ34_01535 [Actinomycetota bacterium]|nr:hypothetical protein [Actinomycetota bacterium]